MNFSKFMVHEFFGIHNPRFFGIQCPTIFCDFGLFNSLAQAGGGGPYYMIFHYQKHTVLNYSQQNYFRNETRCIDENWSGHFNFYLFAWNATKIYIFFLENFPVSCTKLIFLQKICRCIFAFWKIKHLIFVFLLLWLFSRKEQTLITLYLLSISRSKYVVYVISEKLLMTVTLEIILTLRNTNNYKKYNMNGQKYAWFT
jgi:hypothetical protein